MTRRGALALLAISVRALVGDRLEGQTLTTSAPFKVTPANVRIDLAFFKQWEIQHKGETLLITPDELFAALKGK